MGMWNAILIAAAAVCVTCMWIKKNTKMGQKRNLGIAAILILLVNILVPTSSDGRPTHLPFNQGDYEEIFVVDELFSRDDKITLIVRDPRRGPLWVTNTVLGATVGQKVRLVKKYGDLRNVFVPVRVLNDDTVH